jgi:hypothetical protein
MSPHTPSIDMIAIVDGCKSQKSWDNFTRSYELKTFVDSENSFQCQEYSGRCLTGLINTLFCVMHSVFKLI